MKDKLFTSSYLFLCVATFLTSFSFFLLVPTLPFYLIDVYGVEPNMVGVLLSCYVIAVLLVRPFAGFVADIFPRKGVYIVSYLFFALAFWGYLLLKSGLLLFVLLRIFHGFAFGALNTTGNTLVIDIMPSSRRGEGLGYFGVMNNLAMAFGPMMGLFIIGSGNYFLLFSVCLVSASVGLLFGCLVKTKYRPLPTKINSIISLDRFFMIEGLPACFTLFLLAIPYGVTTSYMAMYAEDLGLTSNSGLFFTVMAVGLIVSRLFSGKRVDRGEVTQTIGKGMFIAIVGILGETLLAFAVAMGVTVGYVCYFLSAFFIGCGFGTMFPAFNTLFVNMATNSRRATATATYLTGWDVGIGCGMLLGGYFSNGNFSLCFIFTLSLGIIASCFFKGFVVSHFDEHRLR